MDWDSEESAELERWIQENHEKSFAWALACCMRDYDDAQDVLQAVYLKILDGTARFGGRASMRTWVFSVIRRTALERFRWKRTRERLALLIGMQPARAEMPVDERMQRSETAARLVRALARIPTRQREVIELVFYHDMTIEDAAETLAISTGSARTHYHRAKRRLLAILQKEDGFAFA
jgi:RNA polymerase sigma-70 factor (ECF subfamily)